MRSKPTATGVLALLAAAGVARAGGTPENALLIIDPTNPVSLHIGNYYKNARNLPDSHVLYLDPAAASYAEFRTINQVAFQDTLAQRGIAAPIDYVVLAPTDTFFVPAAGLLVDDCSAVSRFAISSCFTMAQMSSFIVPGTTIATVNQYFVPTTNNNHNNAVGFDASQPYNQGLAAGGAASRRYYIGALLGYTGPRGNTAEQMIAMIDRSVAVDGTRPANSTFYYMNNSPDEARNVRQPAFLAAIGALNARGGTGSQLAGIMPNGQLNIRGVMTGAELLNFTNVNIMPGAFCDHLTSFAGTFDNGGQTKMSEWINAGASGTAGTVEEPCNYLGKFPSPRLHVWYRQGVSLGEAYLRSMEWVPFQSLLYGDPLTRPWAFLPNVSVSNAPTLPVAGSIQLTVTASATAAGASISLLELFVDGVSRGTLIPSVATTFTLDTTTLDDGWHDVRVLARDSTGVRNMGRWTSSIMVNNRGRAASVDVTPGSGDLGQAFTFNVGGSGRPIARIQLLQNGRVIAARTTPGPLTVFGSNLGAGVSTVCAHVTFADGRVARSVPGQVNVFNLTGTPTSEPPVAYAAAKRLATATAHVVELPATYPQGPETPTFTLLSAPAQATVMNPAYPGPYRIIRPVAGATGSETIQYRVDTASGSSTGSMTLIYTEPPVCTADFNGDGNLDPDDLSDFITCFFLDVQFPGTCAEADFNGDGFRDPDDLSDLITAFFLGC